MYYSSPNGIIKKYGWWSADIKWELMDDLPTSLGVGEVECQFSGGTETVGILALSTCTNITYSGTYAVLKLVVD